MNRSEALQFSLSLPNQLGTEKQAMARVAALLEQVHASRERVDDVRTLVSEACLNAMEHGNAFDLSGGYRVSCTIVGGMATICVYDEGRWEGPPPVMQHKDASELGDEVEHLRGWGLRIIDALADTWSMHSSEKGTCVEIQIRISREGG